MTTNDPITQGLLVQRIHTWFVDNQKTLAVAESLTSGRLQAALSLRSGSSKFFLGGITAYTIPMKGILLGVNEDEAKACSCLSASIAQQMARGIIKRTGADYAISTTGFAEPASADGAPTPRAHYCVMKADGFVVLDEGLEEFPLAFSRNDVQDAMATTALQALVKALKI
jgi:nicotinamide-nucleotide amidase